MSRTRFRTAAEQPADNSGRAAAARALYAEIDRLRDQKADLLSALKLIADSWPDDSDGPSAIALAAIRKAGADT